MTQITTTTKTAASLFNSDAAKQKFTELLGKRSSAFITSILSLINSNDALKNADPASVYNAACLAASLDLPVNQNLGFAYIIGYNAKQPDGSFKQMAQFQMGYKGYIQLAQRSGQCAAINAEVIYEGQVLSHDLSGIKFDLTQKKSDTIIGYAAYLKLVNGFEKTLYMTAEEMNEHGKEFSKTFNSNYGLWKTSFNKMALKTVIKKLLATWSPLTIEQFSKAITHDQAVIADDGSAIYVDRNEQFPEPSQLDYLEQLIKTSAFDHDRQDRLIAETQLNDFTMADYDAMKELVENNQIDRISAGMNYTQTDIKKKVKEDVK